MPRRTVTGAAVCNVDDVKEPIAGQHQRAVQRKIELWKAETDQPEGFANLPVGLHKVRRAHYTYNTISSASALQGRRAGVRAARWASDRATGGGRSCPHATFGAASSSTPRKGSRSAIGDDVAWQWAPDSRSRTFSSTRNGSLDVFKQPLHSEIESRSLSPRATELFSSYQGARRLLYMTGP